MHEMLAGAANRRAILGGGLLAAAAALAPGGATAMAASRPYSSRVIRPDLLRAALRSLQAHGRAVRYHDRMAIADFAAPSSQPRFHLLDLLSGTSTSFYVAHGSGSDPARTGYVNRFSNDFGSNASSQGAFLTQDYYVGKHGRSQRLIGLDATNCNALPRNVVVHAAWYANPDMVKNRGMLGRSQGCFAVGEEQLSQVFGLLGPGRMIYAAKV